MTKSQNSLFLGDIRLKHSKEQNIVDEMSTPEETTKEEVLPKKPEMDKRMKEIFDVFDKDADGAVSFKEVVLEMYELTNDLSQSSHAAVNALLMVDGNTSRSMNYEQFSRFFLTVVGACYGDMTFEQVADKVMAEGGTKLIPEDIYAKFEMDANLKMVMTLKEASKEQVDRVDPFQVNRSSRLFGLWDLNSDGYIDFHELALSLRYVLSLSLFTVDDIQTFPFSLIYIHFCLSCRKFEQTATIQTTTEEAFKVLDVFDADGNKRLDRSEFALFLVEFAKTLGTDFDEMVDFMIVTTALKQNTKEDENFIKCIQQ